MSRHRVAGPLLAEPIAPSDVQPGREADDALAQLLGHTELERLYGMVLAFPRAAERLLTERRVPDPVVRCTLRAETVLRLDRPREAMTLASRAVDHAVREEPPPAAGRLLPAVTVMADAAVVAGAPDAVRSCMDLVELARRFGDEHRATVAAGLHAVAVYQQRSCREAIHLLKDLGGSCAEIGIAAVIAQACAAVETCCARGGEPHFSPATLPVITAGGLVHPALTPLFLPDRFQRWRGIHDCTSTASPARPLT
jgi:hypothetical protein